jgi:hypothetical protein
VTLKELMVDTVICDRYGRHALDGMVAYDGHVRSRCKEARLQTALAVSNMGDKQDCHERTNTGREEARHGAKGTRTTGKRRKTGWGTTGRPRASGE